MKENNLFDGRNLLVEDNVIRQEWNYRAIGVGCLSKSKVSTEYGHLKGLVHFPFLLCSY